jgi:hypothetical protein
MTVEQAREQGVCRICGGEIHSQMSSRVTYNYGKEYAHTDCLPKDHLILGVTSEEMTTLLKVAGESIEASLQKGASILIIVGDYVSALFARQNLGQREGVLLANSYIARVTERSLERSDNEPETRHAGVGPDQPTALRSDLPQQPGGADTGGEPGTVKVDRDDQ